MNGPAARRVAASGWESLGLGQRWEAREYIKDDSQKINLGRGKTANAEPAGFFQAIKSAYGYALGVFAVES
jgi:hypothetical protein